MHPLDAFGPRSWTRPEVTGCNRITMSSLPARADRVPLDGEWAFALRGRPEDVTGADLTGPTEGWRTVEVPGCWTMQDTGDGPQYTNIQMPFPPPAAGAETVLYVHVDGRPVAMGKDSRLPHEVDLTGIVQPGVPFELALTVVRWSDATYLEDQDHWYHAGLHRSVSVHATPMVHIADVHATADLDAPPGRPGPVPVVVPAPLTRGRAATAVRLR